MSIVLRILVSLVVFAALFVFTTTVIQAFRPVDTEVDIPRESDRVPVGAKPVRLIIPSISVDADIQHVGITKTGNMATPSNFKDVGWYKFGSIPGNRGSAVIAGHVDNGLGLSGVFKRLGEVPEGEVVEVVYDDGSRNTFEVQSVRRYPYQEVPADIVFNPAGTPRLNLITCEGDWVRSEKTYDERLVVFTKLIE